jgi:hypothetical protein
MTTRTQAHTVGDIALWQLVLDNLIDREMNKVVETARSLMENYFKGKHRLERKQLSNLVGVTGETRSVAVVADFVRYQMGRDERRQSWRAGQPPFGGAVLEQINNLKAQAERLVNQATGQGITPPNRETEIDRVWWTLVRRFAAYLEHSFVYYDKTRQRGGGR